MITDDDDMGSRPESQNSSGRRRWEMHTRESFETCLAMETPSPVGRTLTKHSRDNRQQQAHSAKQKVSVAGSTIYSIIYISFSSSQGPVDGL